MAFLSLTKKAAAKLKIDISKAVVHGLTLPELEDWVVDIIWNVKKNPGIMFYNKATGFVIAINPFEYSLGYCLEIVQQELYYLLKEHGLEDRMVYISNLFSVIHICRNNDRSAVAYMSQSKYLIDFWVNSAGERSVNNSYDLLKRVNDDFRKVDGEYRETRMKEFLAEVTKTNKNSGIVVVQADDGNNEQMH